MSRTYALKRLLEHGPMTTNELIDCTGWGRDVLRFALGRCLSTGVIRRVHGGRHGYAYEASK